MPRLRCPQCQHEVDLAYSTAVCQKINAASGRPCGGRMVAVGGPPQRPPPPPPRNRVPPPPQNPQPAAVPRTYPQALGHVVGSPPPRVDVADLRQGVSGHHQRTVQRAAVNKTLVFTMKSPAPNSKTTNFNYPIKYELYKSDLSRQSPEITIHIPIKVFGIGEGEQYWISRGGTSQTFQTTVHPGPNGQPALGVAEANITESVKQAWSAKINKCWGNVGVIHEKSGDIVQKLGLKFTFDFVDDAAAAAACVICVSTSGAAFQVNPSGTIDAIRWGINDIDPNTLGPICHEVGHLIGNPDEYFEITYQGRTKNWGDGYQADAQFGTMNNPDHPPKIYYYRHLANELAEAFQIPKAEASVIDDISMAATSKRHKLTDHIWA